MKKRKAQVEFVDYDYLEKLSPAEQAWLQEFTNSYYTGGGGKLADGAGAGRDNAARRDIFNHGKRVDLSKGLSEANNDGNVSVSERLADWSDDSSAAATQKRREGYRAYLKRTKRDAGQSAADEPASGGSDDDT